MTKQENKFRVGLAVSGGIAAYKAIEVLRLLQKQNCQVRVTMTRHATEFIQPLTFRALTDSYVLVDDYEPNNPDPIAHINFSQNIDLLLIVPATANILAKFANGIADDFLTSTYLASNAPVMVAPAMNVTMWEHPATRRNIEQLKNDGIHFVEPVAGELACKTVGTGKLEDVENITSQAMALLEGETERRRDGETGRRGDGEKNPLTQYSAPSTQYSAPGTQYSAPDTQDFKGETLLISVGGTREAIDPVRFISNHSSGKMGFALAEAARDRGAVVTVVAGKTSVPPPDNVNIINGVSAEEMYQAVMKELPLANIFVGAAAVADYRPKEMVTSKIKKENKNSLTLELEKTPDILSNVSKNRHEGLMVVGFAAETNNVIEYARSKMERKNLDMVIANDITKKGAGFNTDTNIATIITAESEKSLPLMSKRDLADKILDEIVRLRNK